MIILSSFRQGFVSVSIHIYPYTMICYIYILLTHGILVLIPECTNNKYVSDKTVMVLLLLQYISLNHKKNWLSQRTWANNMGLAYLDAKQ